MISRIVALVQAGLGVQLQEIDGDPSVWINDSTREFKGVCHAFAKPGEAYSDVIERCVSEAESYLARGRK